MRVSFVSQHKVFFSITILVATIIITVQASAYYYYQESIGACPNPCGESTVAIETLINYGNGTSYWINKTDVRSDWNFYQLTSSVARVQATDYPSSSEHLITGINGVQSSGQYFWSLWAICENSKAWFATNVGADAIHFTT